MPETSPLLRKIREQKREYGSPIEEMLGKELEALGLSFRIQEPIGPYFADIYFPDQKLVIECDGKVHRERRSYDLQRDKYMRERGYSVLRFSGNEIHDSPGICAFRIQGMIKGNTYKIAEGLRSGIVEILAEKMSMPESIRNIRIEFSPKKELFEEEIQDDYIFED